MEKTINMITIEERKEQAAIIFQAMNEKDFTLFQQNLAEKFSFHFPGLGLVEGQRKTIFLLRALLRKYPVLRFSIDEVIGEGNRACVVWTNEGQDDAGNPYSNSGITLFHFKENKISFISDYFKDTSFVEFFTPGNG